MNPHFLQTDAWKRFQEALGRQVFEASGTGWHWMAVLEPGRISRLYCPYGPTATSAEALIEAITELSRQAAELGVHFVRIEPRAPITGTELRALGATKAAHNIQPEHTWVIDLTRSEDEILKDFTGTNRRYWLRGKEKLDINFRETSDPEDISIFLDCIHEVSERTGIRPHSDEYFKLQARTLIPLKAASLMITELDGQPAATVLAYDSPTTRYYAHAAAHYQYHKLQPSTGAIIYAILEAKKAGKQYFDLCGVAPPNQPDHPWMGFTRFKQSFGGYAVDYLGTWDIPLKGNWYRAYRAAGAALTARRNVHKRLKQLRQHKAKS